MSTPSKESIEEIERRNMLEAKSRDSASSESLETLLWSIEDHRDEYGGLFLVTHERKLWFHHLCIHALEAIIADHNAALKP